MFETRVKILLGVLLAVAGLLGLRAFQLQVVEKREWAERAKAALKRQQLTDTVRGSILDVRGRVIARDEACIDAAVEFKVVQDPPDEAWVRAEARRRLSGRTEGLTRAERQAKLGEEVAAVKADIEAMWAELARMPGSSPQLVAERRREIVRRVEARRRSVWYRNYELAVRKHEDAPRPPWYKRWIAGSDADAPRLEQFEVEVGEELEAHPVLSNISTEVNNHLAKNLSRLPGLRLRAGVARVYPFGDAGAHLLGHLKPVTREDLVADDSDDELREYLPNDKIGRAGLEQLFESQLRGSRGRRVLVGGQWDDAEEVRPVRGGDVATTVDIELQGKVQELFRHARFKVGENAYEKTTMHGAAVVIDIPTGEVRAMASYPTYDPNTLDSAYDKLLDDEINLPLLNRATMSMLEPGSTVKPLVGLAAITQGVVSPGQAIECNGYLVVGGRQYTVGRCWTMTRFKIGHHQTPWEDPHPTGSLTFPEALQRSCNIYFEVCGDKLGVSGLGEWMMKFGLGRPTGIGVAEAAGRVPSQVPVPDYLRKSVSWFGGIGQGKVQTTPLQMANVAATIARDGLWMRPRLVPAGAELPARLRADGIPQQTDLRLNPAAAKMARDGMVKVVNTRAGTGTALKREDITVAGKTGTAQAAPFTYRKRDADGKLVLDASGRVVREELRLSTAGNVNPLAPWYRGTGASGTDRAHAWFIGFAPAENPRIAFCVLVEYGGGGGSAAAPIARDIVQACIDAGYLEGKKSSEPEGQVTR